MQGSHRKPQPIVRDDRAMISDPSRWPRWPWLPVKRNIKTEHKDMLELQCGVVHADQNGIPYPENYTTKISVFNTNMHEVRHYFPTKDMVAKAIVYETLDAMLADGWVVD